MDESSHVRFQESDLDALDNYSERNNNESRGGDVEADVIEEEGQRVYSEVCDPPEQMVGTNSVKRVHYRDDVDPTPRPMVRRRKRRERDSRRVRQEERRERRKESNEDDDGFDWLAGAGGESEVLRAMVHKLSVELGREQGRRKETGHQLVDEEESSWLTELGGLVPLLVAYEEELRELKAAKNELQQVVEKDQVGVAGMLADNVKLQVRLEELVEDNTEMAGQLREIAMTGWRKPNPCENHLKPRTS